jgi:hypothetical protein
LAACEDTSPTQSESVDAPQLFAESAVATGLEFDHFIGATGQYYLPEIMGSGVALFDFDLDGDLDVYFLQGAMLDESKPPEESTFPPKSGVVNRLFENRMVPDGRLQFVDATAASGLGHKGYGMGVAVGDYDGDGYPDLYVTNWGPNVLYRNNGDGTFREVDGPQDDRWSTSAAFLDYDGDGDLDLFFTNYVNFTVRGNLECFDPVGLRDYCAPRAYQPVPDRLFRNDGGKFTDVTNAAGLGSKFGNGLGVTVADFNTDGRVDVYVANDGMENQLWINRADGTFEERGMLSGTAVNVDGRVEAGMGVSAADFDNDGDEDLFMTHLTREKNTLYLNDGKGAFRDATSQFGLAASSVPFTGFGLQWKDFDFDGRLDLFITNGAVTVVESQRGSPYPFLQDDLFYRGTEAGYEVVAGSLVWGEQAPLIGRGMAAGDLDNDGDIDVVISNNNGPARLYLNQIGNPAFVKVVPAGNSLGARVGVSFSDGTTAWRRVHADGSYLSSSEAAAVFGLMGGKTATSMEIIWPNGDREQFAAPAAGTVFRPIKGSAARP